MMQYNFNQGEPMPSNPTPSLQRGASMFQKPDTVSRGNQDDTGGFLPNDSMLGSNKQEDSVSQESGEDLGNIDLANLRPSTIKKGSIQQAFFGDLSPTGSILKKRDQKNLRKSNRQEMQKNQSRQDYTSSMPYTLMNKQASQGDDFLMMEPSINRNNSRMSYLSTSSRKTRGLGKKTLERQAKIERDQALAVTKQRTTTVENLTCKCAKSQCLKMYCECFTHKRFCDDRCKCLNCKNVPENKERITAARKAIRSRNPQAFKPKVLHHVEMQGPDGLKLKKQVSTMSKTSGKSNRRAEKAAVNLLLKKQNSSRRGPRGGIVTD
mmetsp:Transcript_32990/g.50492  ORF Transcript_32990/g.50492 Transcript_32990/m.50492 type:complete len:322 (+) Transcript_32990:1679-2644(+)